MPLIQEDDRERQRFSIVDAWIANSNHNFDVQTPKGREDLKAAISLIKNHYLKSALATTYVKKEADVEKRFSDFYALASEHFFNSSYDTPEVQKRYAEADLPKVKIPDLCKKLYPNSELYQVKLFTKFVNSGAFDAEDKDLIKEFVKEIKDDKDALKVINSVDYIIRDANDILDIASKRLGTSYQSVREFLQKPLIDFTDETGQLVAGSLTESGIEELKELFGADVFSKRNLADLFSYYDIKGNLNGFKKIVKKEVLAGMKEGYAPTADSPFVSREEYQKLKLLLFPDILPEEINLSQNAELTDAELKMPKVELLSQYLASKTQVIPPMSVEEIKSYQINFPKPPSLGEEVESRTEEHREMAELSEIQEQLFHSLLSDQKIPVQDNESSRKIFEEANVFGRQIQIRGIFTDIIAKQKDLLKTKKMALKNSILSEYEKQELEGEKNRQEEMCKLLEEQRDKADRIYDEMRWVEVPRIFKEILLKENSLVKDASGSVVRASKEEVAYFFTFALNLESEISEANKVKLLDFFQTNNQKLAYYFNIDGGLDEYCAIMHGAGDGCVANIATQSDFALTKYLIKDACDQKLYSLFSEKISNPILNSGVDDHLGGSAKGAGVFTNSLVNESRISPNGLFEKLKEEFSKNSKTWDFIIEQIGAQGKKI